MLATTEMPPSTWARAQCPCCTEHLRRIDQLERRLRAAGLPVPPKIGTRSSPPPHTRRPTGPPPPRLPPVSSSAPRRATAADMAAVCGAGLQSACLRGTSLQPRRSPSFGPSPARPGAPEVVVAAVRIQRAVRGWLLRRRFDRAAREIRRRAASGVREEWRARRLRVPPPAAALRPQS